VLQTLTGHDNNVLCVCISDGPSGLLASGSSDTSIRLYNAFTGEAKGEPLQGHDNSVLCVAFSPVTDPSNPLPHWLASGSDDNTARRWDIWAGKPGPTLSDHTNSVAGVAFTPPSDKQALLATGSCDNTIRLYAVDSWEQVGEPLEAHTDSVKAVAFSLSSSTPLACWPLEGMTTA